MKRSLIVFKTCFVLFMLLLLCCKSDDGREDCPIPYGSMNTLINGAISFNADYIGFVDMPENRLEIGIEDYTSTCLGQGLLLLNINKELGTQQLDADRLNRFVELDDDTAVGEFLLSTEDEATLEIVRIDADEVEGILNATYIFNTESPNSSITLPETLKFTNAAFIAESRN